VALRAARVVDADGGPPIFDRNLAHRNANALRPFDENFP
jgi:hypothetical protein